MHGKYFQQLRTVFRCAGLAIVMAATLSGCSISRHILYSPRNAPVAVEWTGTPPQTVSVRTQDKLDLRGYFWPGTPGDPDVILFFHGRNWNADMGANVAQHLAGAGNAVLVASYRGFGGNPGHPTEAGLLRDAGAFLAKAGTLAGPNARIWLVGHSIGAAVALQAAASDPHVKGVFAMSAFVRIAAAAPKATRAFIPDRWNNLDALKRLHMPVIFVQGGLDRLIPQGSGNTLFSSFAGPASLVVGETSRHNPDMTILAPWINKTIDTMQGQSLTNLPAPPSGWVEKGRRP